jgi:hypothetical protein
MSATMSATATIAVCVMLTLLVFVIDGWSILRARRTVLEVLRQDPLQDPLQDPIDPDVR